MKISVYQKERIESDLLVQEDLSTRFKRQISNAFSLLSSVHYIHFSWLSL
jgi:hypothetical protein